MHRLIADDAVAFADGVVEAGQALAARGGLDPEAELADLDGLGIQVHAVEVVLEDLPVEVEEGALAAQFLQPGVGGFIEGVELVEGLDEERAAAAGRVENSEALERLLPRLPEADEGVALRFVERGQVRRRLGSASDLRAVPAASASCCWRNASKAVLQHAAQRLADDVAGDESGGIDCAFLLAPLSCLSFIHWDQFPLTPALSPEERRIVARPCANGASSPQPSLLLRRRGRSTGRDSAGLKAQP